MEKTARADYGRPGCDQCKFCGVVMGIGKEVSFVCRFKPPVVTAQLVPTPEGLAWQGMAMWPNVSKLDWCGEFVAVEH